jgi:FlaG/FlaF family flagellin (archaellin)
MIPVKIRPRNSHDDAVSAVISVVLLVALTVIIAAIVATYALGMTKNIPDTKLITTSITNVDANHVTVTYSGGQDRDICVGVRWVLTRSDGTFLATTLMGSTSPTADALTVGISKTLTASWSGKKHITATAYFKDNTQQVILDTFIG